MIPNGMQGIQINVRDYIQAKAAGVTKVVRLNGVPHYTRKGFDPATGKPVPILVQLDRDQVDASIAQMESDLDNMRAMLTDMDAAQEAI